MKIKNFTEFGYSRQIIKYGRWLANAISTLWISGKNGIWDFWAFISTIWEMVYTGQRASLLIDIDSFWLHLLKDGLCGAMCFSILCTSLAIGITIIDSFDYTIGRRCMRGNEHSNMVYVAILFRTSYQLITSRSGYRSRELS